MSPSAEASRPEPGRDVTGVVMAAGSAAALGLAIAIARLAYEGGSNGITVAAIRSMVAVSGLYLVCRLSGRRLAIAPRDLLHCAGLGVLTAVMSWGNVGSVEFIPVGLAALLFFTFPPMVAVIQAVVLRDPPPWPKAAAVAGAFAGLALMLGVSLEASDPRGVAMALGAGVAVAWHSVWLARRMAHLDALVLTFYMAAVATVVLALPALALGNVSLPRGAAGWLGLAGVVVLQSSAFPLYYAAVQRIGALRCAVLANTQPVTSIVAAWLLYGEVLTPVQMAGGALVIGGILVMQWHDARTRAETPERSEDD